MNHTLAKEDIYDVAPGAVHTKSDGNSCVDDEKKREVQFTRGQLPCGVRVLIGCAKSPLQCQRQKDLRRGLVILHFEL